MLIFLGMMILFALGVPIAVGIGMAATGYLLSSSPVPLVIVPQRLFVSIDTFPFMAIPCFVLAGSLMEVGGISRQLVRMADALVGHRVGGLAMVTIVTSMFFAAVSGSSPATVSAVGGILIPAMIAKGYRKSFAASVQACSGQMGVIIPPSIPMVVYGVSTNTSIGSLFKAGVLPGLIMGFSLMILAFFVCDRLGYKGNERRATWTERLHAVKEAVWALIMPLIILGGVYSGYFTPTEAAAIAVGYSWFVGTFIYKGLNRGNLVDSLGNAAVTTAGIMFLIASAGLLAWLMGRMNVAQQVGAFVSSFTNNDKYLFILIANLLLFFVGMFFDAGPAIIILAPLLTPIAGGLGIDPVHFGIIMVVNLAIGFCTPPVGINLFISCQIAGIRLEEIMRDVYLFLAVLVLNVALISFVPFVSLALV